VRRALTALETEIQGADGVQGGGGVRSAAKDRHVILRERRGSFRDPGAGALFALVRVRGRHTLRARLTRIVVDLTGRPR
jgi:hypothetical protein